MNTFLRYYQAEPDASFASWVIHRCIGPKHTLHTIVPSGFENYIRICHPASLLAPIDPDDELAWSYLNAGWNDPERKTLVRWDEVADMNDITPDRLMQWHQICAPTVQPPGSGGIEPPLEGELTAQMMLNIFDILCDYDGSEQEVMCGFWEGYNIYNDIPEAAKFESFPGRGNYLLFRSVLSKVKEGWLAASDQALNHHRFEISGLVPNAIWPTTCDWYLALPYNLPSSYFGGPKHLVNKISRNDCLEIYEALPGDNIYKSTTG